MGCRCRCRCPNRRMNLSKRCNSPIRQWWGNRCPRRTIRMEVRKGAAWPPATRPQPSKRAKLSGVDLMAQQTSSRNPPPDCTPSGRGAPQRPRQNKHHRGQPLGAGAAASASGRKRRTKTWPPPAPVRGGRISRWPRRENAPRASPSTDALRASMKSIQSEHPFRATGVYAAVIRPSWRCDDALTNQPRRSTEG